VAQFAIKAEINQPRAKVFTFVSQKTMYGGKQIAAGDTIFVFSSETQGGHGLLARAVVTSSQAIPRQRDPIRQTPRVSIIVRRTALTKRQLGRSGTTVSPEPSSTSSYIGKQPTRSSVSPPLLQSS
jgi:hypothetical protein